MRELLLALNNTHVSRLRPVISRLTILGTIKQAEQQRVGLLLARMDLDGSHHATLRMKRNLAVGTRRECDTHSVRGKHPNKLLCLQDAESDPSPTAPDFRVAS